MPPMNSSGRKKYCLSTSVLHSGIPGGLELLLLCVIEIFYGVIRWRLLQRFRLKLERSEKEKQLADFGQKNAELQQQKTEMEMQALACTNEPAFYF